MAVTKPDAHPVDTMLNRGIYDAREVARLIHRDPDTVARWTTRRRRAPALLEPQLGGLFSFLDLVSLYVISELITRGVRRVEIVAGAQYLAAQLETERPYAHKQLATVGRSFFAEVGEWVDAGKGGQGAFPAIVKPLLRPITYDTSGLASIWRPHAEIWINPMVQTGSPCVDGTRVPSALVAKLIADEEEPVDVADDFGLTVAQVEAAVDYESGLSRAA